MLRYSADDARRSRSCASCSGEVSPSIESCINSIASVLFIAFRQQRIAQHLPRAEKPRLHRLLRHIENLRHLGIRQVEEMAKDDDRAIVRLELHDLFMKMRPGLQFLEFLGRVRERVGELL